MVTGSVELESQQAGPPDAGTATGHGGDAAGASTRRAWFVLRGSVQPADSEVRVLDARYGGLSAVPERRGGAFSARLTLRPGVNRFIVEGTKPDHKPWRLDVRIVRRRTASALAPTVAVPLVDRIPPAALLRLDGERLLATAVGRDAGGIARIRVSAELEIACRSGRKEAIVLHVPPSLIAKEKVVPGTRLPTRRSRRVDLSRTAMRRCGGPVRDVSGRAWAEATDAHGRDGYSRYVPVGS